jgi:hypothetical protein
MRIPVDEFGNEIYVPQPTTTYYRGEPATIRGKVTGPTEAAKPKKVEPVEDPAVNGGEPKDSDDTGTPKLPKDGVKKNGDAKSGEKNDTELNGADGKKNNTTGTPRSKFNLREKSA